MKQSTLKILALAMALCMAVGTLVGCSQPATAPAAQAATTEESAKSGEKIQLRMIDTLANEVRTAAIQKIIDDYEALNPNVSIELLSPPTEGADQKVQQMLQSDEQLDIIDTGNGFQVCINNGWIQPLNKYLEDWDELSTISDAAMSRTTIFAEDGKTMWCIPYGIYQMLLFYRKDMLANAGIEVPDVWTWDNIYEIATKMTDPAKGTYGWAFRGGTRGQFVYDYMLLGFLSNDKVNANENYRYLTPEGGSIFRTEEAKTALEFYKSIYKNCSPSDSIAWGFTEMVQGFMSGTCALLLQDNDVIQSCESGLDASLWGVGNVPIGPADFGTQSCGYGGWAMSAKTEYPEQAADFIKFLSNAENNGYFCEKTGLIPIHTTTIEQNAYFSSGVYEVFNKMNEIGKYRIFSAGGVSYDIAATFGNDRDEYLQKYLMDEVSADDLLNYWAEQWEKAVADQGQLW